MNSYCIWKKLKKKKNSRINSDNAPSEYYPSVSFYAHHIAAIPCLQWKKWNALASKIAARSVNCELVKSNQAKNEKRIAQKNCLSPVVANIRGVAVSVLNEWNFDCNRAMMSKYYTHSTLLYARNFRISFTLCICVHYNSNNCTSRSKRRKREEEEEDNEQKVNVK